MYILNNLRYKLSAIIITLLSLMQVKELSGQTISGPTCVLTSQLLTYTISGVTSGQVCVTGGGIIYQGSGGCKTISANPTTIRIQWSSAGTVTITGHPTSTLNVTLAPAIQGNTPTNLTQNISYNTTPASIICPAATGGSCTPSYTYQWQSSSNDVSFSNVSGATSLNLSFSSPLISTTYYRRMVTETVSGTVAYSSSATIFVYPQSQGGNAMPTSQNINYNSIPSQLSVTGVSGGDGTYTYQWQSSPNSSSWTNISSATLSSYTPPQLTATTYYRVLVTSIGVTVNSTSALVTVYPALQPGSSSPSTQTINYNTNAGLLTASGISGGNGTYTYQWQSSPDNSNWTSISAATSSTYSPGVLSYTSWYRAIVTSNGVSGNSTSAKVSVNPQVLSGYVNPSNINIASGTSPGIITASPASGGNCGTSYTYQWQSSTDGIIFSAIGGATAQNYIPGNQSLNIWFRRQVTCSGDVEYSNICRVTIVTNTDINYIRVRDISKSGIADSASAANLTDPNDVKQTTQYFDGLGRLIQTVSQRSTPLQKDFVAINDYDPFGREVANYLPYTATGTDGKYKPTAIQDQYSFNTIQFPSEQYYYGQINYEVSPLNRVISTYAPGLNWTGSRGTATEKSIQQQNLVNQVSDSVRLWNIAYTVGSIPTTFSMYAVGTLYKDITIDESGHQVVEYKDIDGHIVLKKIQLSASPGTAHAGWLCTYYIYDDLNHLRFVIQPIGVQLINANWTITTAIANELCFRYEYDYRGRMIIKKIPGAGEAWMVYDGRDRLVMSQDSALRFQHKWVFIKYDDENRSDSTGLITDNTNYNNLTYHQNLAANSAAYPNVSIYTNELLTQTYYDDYSWVAGTGSGLSTTMATGYNANSTYFITGYNTSPAYSQPLTQFNITRGLPTGSKTKVIGTASQFLYSVNLYDDRGRTIQTQSVNYTGGIDTSLVQYSFDGKTLRTLLLQKKNGTNAQAHKILTKMTYDAGNRLATVAKNIDNAGSDQTIASNTYNELGQLQNKQLGNSIENLAYAYNIRGWLTSINKNFIAGIGSSYFGMELGYDKTASAAGTTSYTTPQYNGNIEGTVWRSKGDGINRKYDFGYDNANRLTNAVFLQNTTGSTWDNSYLDFTVNNLQYDANGNILSMNQKGFKINGSATIDQLAYTYQPTSNKLSKVDDVANDPTSKLGDFHYTGTKQATDYSYDGNGNLISDNNKSISAIVYNYLNLPQNLTVTAKGSITYTYDAGGNKLAKTTIDNTTAPSKTITTLYMSGMVYQNDTLQFISHEEGRARWAFHRYLNGSSKYGWEYDYFIKDHLGNTRMVLTQQKDTSQYIATMESAYRATENQLFYNIPSSSYPRSAVAGYPTDNTTVPNDSLARVNGSGQKTGPSILLRVMSGDVVDVATKSFYKSGGTAQSPNSTLTDILNSLASGIVTATSASHGVVSDLTNTSSSPLYAALNSFLPTNDPNTTGKPKAYLNWILLDDQFKGVNTYPQSGAIPVGSADLLNTLAYSGISVTKNGYLYIWVSNETPGWDVFFDNLSIKQYSGVITEETHYYPFGLTMAGISSKSAGGIENKYKFNKGSELQNKEFSDGSGLELYATPLRSLDPQLGRWWQIDSKPGYAQSLYSSMGNNPILRNDPLGDTPRVLNEMIQENRIRQNEVNIHNSNLRNKKNAPPLFSFTATTTTGTYAGKGKVFGIGVEYGASHNEKDLSGIRNSKNIKKNEKGYRNGMSASVPGFGAELNIESHKKIDVDGKLPEKYTVEQNKSVPFETEVEKKDESGNEIYSGRQIEIFSLKLGFGFGIDLSLKVNIPNNNMESVPEPPPIGRSVPDNTYVKTNTILN